MSKKLRQLASPTDKTRDMKPLNNIRSTWREDDSDYFEVILSEEFKLDDTPPTDLLRGGSALSELSLESSVESSEGFEYPWESTAKPKAIRHINFAHQEQRNSKSSIVEETDDLSTTSDLSSPSLINPSERKKGSGNRHSKTPAPPHSERSLYSNHSRTENGGGDAESVVSFANSDRSSVICSIAKRHVYGDQRYPSTSPVTPGGRKKKGSSSSRLSTGERPSLPMRKNSNEKLRVSRGDRSPVPPSPRERKQRNRLSTGERYSISSSRQPSISESEILKTSYEEDSVHSSSRSPVPPPRGRKKGTRHSTGVSSTRKPSSERLKKSQEGQRPSSWSPVPPKDRKHHGGERYSLSSGNRLSTYSVSSRQPSISESEILQTSSNEDALSNSKRGRRKIKYIKKSSMSRRIPSIEGTSNGDERPSSWSPVPPTDRKHQGNNRLSTYSLSSRQSVSSRQPSISESEILRFSNDEDPLSNSERSSSRSPALPKRRKKASRASSPNRGQPRTSENKDPLSNSERSPVTPGGRRKVNRTVSADGGQFPLSSSDRSSRSPVTPGGRRKVKRTVSADGDLCRLSGSDRSISKSPVNKSPGSRRRVNRTISAGEQYSTSPKKPSSTIMRILGEDPESSPSERSSSRRTARGRKNKNKPSSEILKILGDDDPLSNSERSSSIRKTPRGRKKKKPSSERVRPLSAGPLDRSDRGRNEGKPSSQRVRTSSEGALDRSERSCSRSPAPPRGRKKRQPSSERLRGARSRQSSSERLRGARSRSPRRIGQRSAQLDDSERSGRSYESDFDDDNMSRGSTHFSRRFNGRNNDALSVSEKLMTSEYEGKVRSVMDGLSINKLRYDEVGLVGREDETKILRKCYSRLTDITDDESSRPEKEVVFVHGYLGVGKSSLVSSMLEMCDQSATGFCARGKFGFSNVDVPYTAIASAYSQIFENIEKSGSLAVSTYNESGRLQTLGEVLTEKLGPDMHLLARLIPNMKGMIPQFVRQPSFRRRDSNGFDASQNQWESALLVLTRELNKIYSPLVLFLDDMHWADSASLNLIESLISDVENQNPFMVIGCYRSNAVGEGHILPEKVEQLAIKKSNYGFNLSEMEIDNLDKEGVQDVIMTLLSMDDKKTTEGLADICFRRTLGNPFFLIEFMTMLNDEELIKFSLGSLKWTWDEEEVERETMSSENVVDIVHSRMKKLSHNAQTILKYAACLGSTIRVECLEILISQLEVNEDGDISLSKSISQLEKGGFIEKIQNDEYRWAHDNIRESALMLGDAATRFFQFEVGNTLFHFLDDYDLDEILFEVCDLINLGEHSRRAEFAKLNLRAAEKARRISAFQIATEYAIKGITYLQNDKWTEQHDLTLQLYTLAMEMELAVGRIEEMEKYSEEVLAQPNCTPIEKLPVYLAKSHKMTHMDMDHKGCTDLLLGILSENFKIQLFSRKAILPVQAITSLMSVVRTVKKMPKGALSSLKPIENFDLQAAMELLIRLSISAYLGKDMLLHIRCITKMVQMTLKHGVHSMSGFAFLGLGTCVMVLNHGDASEGASFAQMANELHAIAPDDHAAASTTTVSNLLVLPWISTLSSCRSALQEGYSSGLRAGNTENAMLSLFAYNIMMPLQMGKPLPSIESKCAAIAAQCEELKLGIYAGSVRQHWELILELMGKPDKSVFTKSEVLKKEGWKPETLMTEYIELHSLVYSGDFEAAAEIALRMGDGFQKAHPSNMLIMSETFLRALALYASSSSSNNHHHHHHSIMDSSLHSMMDSSIRQANKLRQKIGNWVKKGNPNVGHCYHLLCAEKARLDGKYDNATSLYNDAIVLAARTGHIPHAALANERYGNFALWCKNDKEESDYRIREAIRYYQDWGANKRVQELTQQLNADNSNN